MAEEDIYVRKSLGMHGVLEPKTYARHIYGVDVERGKDLQEWEETRMGSVVLNWTGKYWCELMIINVSRDVFYTRINMHVHMQIL